MNRSASTLYFNKQNLFNDSNYEPIIPLASNGLHEAITAVIAGYGASFVSSLAVREFVERGELSRVFVEDIHLKNTIAICTRKNEPLSASALNLIHMIRQNPFLKE
jgi:DNA-binding transcriptional LysR family regulator